MSNPTMLWIAVAIVAAILVKLSWRLVQQYQGGVVLRLGRLKNVRPPGLNLIVPLFDRMYLIDTRTVTLTVEPQEVITRDNVTIKVDAVVYFAVVDPAKALLQVVDYMKATTQIALTTLRSVLGQSELDELLSRRDKINSTLRQIIDEHTEPWGVKVTAVEVKQVDLPDEMRRAMAKQAEAERERRSKIIAAEGEFQASEKLGQAADVIGKSPGALQLRYLQTLVEISAEKNSTIIFPLPIDIVRPFLDAAAAKK